VKESSAILGDSWPSGPDGAADRLAGQRPAPAARSNSYNFVPVRDFLRAAGDPPCPLRPRPAIGREGGRTLLVRLRDRMRLVRTTTRDFSEEELAATKDRLGQLYADVSTKLAPDDFARDLRKLRPSEECEGCVRQPACPGAWEAVPEDVFGRDDARVRAILAGLHGRVLDVGGGEAGYLEVLAGRAAAGEVEYVCVDPDAARLTVLASRYPFARFVVGRAEGLSAAHPGARPGAGPDLGRFDHVLFLRSYNHLDDPAEALARALSLLAPGGSLLLVDNVAFGLVRSAAHAARAEAAPGNLLEHYRNDGAGEADAAVRAALARQPRIPSLRLLERRDVGPDTSNQWLLRYQ
jgi:SAM-dependent methyltransferase